MSTVRRRSRIAESSVWVEPAVEVEIFEEAGYCHPLETGGVLLGYSDLDDPNNILVSAQIGPGPKAVHRHARFAPDAEWQQERIEKTYCDSGQVVTYLGDWHSHPVGGSHPSRIDRRTARRISRTRRARAPQPLIIVAHGGPGEWRLSPYRWSRRRLRPARLISD